MSEKPKRLKKNISFSQHEKDIYEYLESVGNASALIKRLVYNHMIIEKGLVVPVVDIQAKDKNPKVSQKSSDEKPKGPEKPKELTPEELENMRLAQELDI